MIQGYKVTTYTILAHKGLRKTFQLAMQDKRYNEETRQAQIPSGGDYISLGDDHK